MSIFISTCLHNSFQLEPFIVYTLRSVKGIEIQMIRFDTLPPAVTQAMCTPMHQILAPTSLPSGSPSPTTGALYLGSLAAVYDLGALREAHISHIVQVLDLPWMPLTENEGFSCYKIPVMDDIAVDLRPHLEAACTNIDKALRSGKSVLVHCQQVSFHPQNTAWIIVLPYPSLPL